MVAGMITPQIIPITDDTLLAEVADIANKAKARGMFLISNGRKVVVSPVCPPGFYKLAIKVRDRSTATLDALPCAA